ncbi:uncharacterized protein LOC124887129 [Capsicum annuum]|uniref:uncharacterized protein LOC124887129 n=1 Tax=Capsicum annuum TaxID=4072 RepID=UPI001FB077D3|nr:uncharacterized protein LOC124887129 [Capsicum annuum]
MQQTQNAWPQVCVPSNTEPPKQVIAITLKSGKELNKEPPKTTKEVKEIPSPPFTQRLLKSKEDMCFKKFFETFREIHINLSLLDVLPGMPKYAKNLKDVVSKKLKLHDVEIVTLNEECLGKSRSRFVLFQLADRTIAHSKEITKDVLIKADEKVPVILGHPFLVMEGVLIDVREGMLIMRIDDKKVVFKVYKPLKTLSNYKDLCIITVIEEDKYGVVEFSPPKTSLDFHIEQPRRQPPHPKIMQIDDPEKAIIERVDEKLSIEKPELRSMAKTKCRVLGPS